MEPTARPLLFGVFKRTSPPVFAASALLAGALSEPDVGEPLPSKAGERDLQEQCATDPASAPSREAGP